MCNCYFDDAVCYTSTKIRQPYTAIFQVDLS